MDESFSHDIEAINADYRARKITLWLSKRRCPWLSLNWRLLCATIESLLMQVSKGTRLTKR